MDLNEYMLSDYDIPEIDMMHPAKIKVVGVGGGGCNAVNHMVQSGVKGVEFIAINTDTQVLSQLPDTVEKVIIGKKLTKGRGAGNDPKIGEQSALEDIESIERAVEGADMVFVTAGMGGGTGTGAAPVVSKVARDLGSLVVAIVTTPFKFEPRRRVIAQQGLEKLREYVDSIIIIPNDKVLQRHKKLRYMGAIKVANDILRQAVQGISDIVNFPGHINVDFADVKRIFQHRGEAIMGIGKATGNDRAKKAIREAIDNPLVETGSMSGASALLVNITMPSHNEALMEEIAEIMDEATGILRKDLPDEDKEVIFGTTIDESGSDELRVVVIATGFSRKNGHSRKKSSSTETKEDSRDETSVEHRKSHNVDPEFERWRRNNSSKILELDDDFGDSLIGDLERPAISRKRGGGFGEGFSY